MIYIYIYIRAEKGAAQEVLGSYLRVTNGSIIRMRPVGCILVYSYPKTVGYIAQEATTWVSWSPRVCKGCKEEP